MTRWARSLLLALGVAAGVSLLASCWERGVAEVQVGEIEVHPSLASLGLELVTPITLTPRFSAVVREIDLDVAVGGVPLDVRWGGLEVGTHLQGGEPLNVRAVTLVGPLDALAVGLSALRQKDVEVTIDGEIVVGVLGIPWTVPVSLRTSVGRASTP